MGIRRCTKNVAKVCVACSIFGRSYKRYCDARKATATPERIITDARYAIRYRNACKATAICERRRADARDTIADSYAR